MLVVLELKERDSCPKLVFVFVKFVSTDNKYFMKTVKHNVLQISINIQQHLMLHKSFTK